MNISSFNSQDKDVIQKAVDYATRAHSGQFRKQIELPYISHPMAVLSKLAEWKVVHVETWCIALLHDVLEDCPDYTVADIEREFGPLVANCVNELTFIPKKDIDASFEQQKDEYLATFKDSHPVSLLVKISDRLVNTGNYLVHDAKRAKKYWAKAGKLFEAFFARTAELESFYGKIVVGNADAAIFRMESPLSLIFA